MSFGWMVFQLVAAYVISYAMQPKQQGPTATAFGDIDFPQAEDGTPQCVVFGDCWVTDWTVLGVGNYAVEPIKAGGGKK